MNNIINNIKGWGILVAIVMAMVGCNKDGDIVTVGDTSAITLNGSNTVKLDEKNPGGLAMTLYWNDNDGLATNYSDVLLPNNVISNSIQISRTKDFEQFYTLKMDSGVCQKQYSNKELNSELTKLKFIPYVEQDMFVRIASSIGNNITPQYSNVMTFRVMPYKIDFSFASVLNADKSDSGAKLYSPEENGIYSGFISLGAWGNWWMQENDGTVWGNINEDGKAFVISNATTAWNLWGSQHNGCRYVIVDTKKLCWMEYAIPSVTVSGDVSGEMTYNKTDRKWTLTFTAADTNPVNVSFAAPDAAYYNMDTGTESGTATPLTFTENGISTDGSAAKVFTITPPAAGLCTISIDFSSAENVVEYKIEEGGTEPEEKVNPILCVMGNDDKWDHDEWIRLSDEDNKTYTGAVFMNSSWGYYFTKTTDSSDWTAINQDPDTSDKKLKEGGDNIPAPGSGLYIVSASLGWMSYWYEANGETVTSVAYTGLNNEWNVNTMTATETPGIYTADVTVTADAQWGVKILINGSWDYWFGTKADGSLVWNKVDNGNPAGVEIGKSYTLTVDICRGTYSFTSK